MLRNILAEQGTVHNGERGGERGGVCVYKWCHSKRCLLVRKENVKRLWTLGSKEEEEEEVPRVAVPQRREKHKRPEEALLPSRKMVSSSSLHNALSVPIAQPQARLGTVLLQVRQLLGVDRPTSLLPYKLHSIFICHA